MFVSEQLEDYRTVIKFVRGQEDLYDPHRVILWGFSFAGGHVVTLSGENLGIAATIAQSPYIARSLSFVWSLLYFKNLGLAILDLLAQALHLSPVYTRTVARPGEVGFITKPGAFEGFYFANQVTGDFPNQIAASVFFRVPLYRPQDSVPRIDSPILFIAPRDDDVCPYSLTVEASRIPPRAELLEILGSHFDMFPDAIAFKTCLQTQLDFLSKNVPL